MKHDISAIKKTKVVKPLKTQPDLKGDEAPRIKDFMMVLITILALILLAWLAYHQFHWFH